MSTEPTSRTGGLPAAIDAVILYRLATILAGGLPGVVEKYDYKRRKANIKPQVQRRLASGKLAPLPVLPAVPVVFPHSTSTGGLRFDLKRGDTGLLTFSQRSLERWLAQGGDADPVDPRKFDISDAIFQPGLRPFNGQDADSVAGSLVLDYGGAKLRMKDGKVALGNDTAELLDLVDQLLTKLESTVVATAVGTYPLSTATGDLMAPLLLAIQTKLTLIRGTLG